MWLLVEFVLFVGPENIISVAVFSSYLVNYKILVIPPCNNLYVGVRPPPTIVFDMTLNNLMVTLQ